MKKLLLILLLSGCCDPNAPLREAQKKGNVVRIGSHECQKIEVEKTVCVFCHSFQNVNSLSCDWGTK